MMRTSNSLLRPHPACFFTWPFGRMVVRVRPVWTNVLLNILFSSGQQLPSSSAQGLPTRLLLPKVLSHLKVVEGRVRSLTFIAVLVLAAFACPRTASAEKSPASCTVSLRAQAAITGSGLVLGDIADLIGDDAELVTQLGRLPLGTVNGVRLLTRSEVLSAIREVIPRTVNVQMAGAEFSRVAISMRSPEASEIAAVLKAHLAAISSWREEEIEIRSIDNLKSIELPAGNIQLRAISRGIPSSYRNAMLLLEAVLDEKPVRTFWVKADIHIRARVVQVVQAVPFRKSLRAVDLCEVVAEIEDPRAEYIRICAEAVGLTAKRTLPQGELLTRSSVEEADLVRSGETVRLVAQSGGIRVTALVQALQNGKLGSRIRVKNVGSDRAITAVVTGRGEVQITR